MLPIVLSLVAGGCAATGEPGVATGLSLDLEHRRGEDSIALYRVRPDDTIAFGGGRDALDGATPWSGPLTADEAARLRTLLDGQGWFDPRPVVTDAGADVAYRVALSGPGGSARFALEGESEAMIPLRTLLETAAARRLDPVLRRLPRPTSSTP